jgi:hypothetical protein
MLVRVPKALKVLDYCLSFNSKRVETRVRLQAAEFVLKRIFPEKRIIEGEFTGKFEHFYELAVNELERKEETFLGRVTEGRGPSSN